MNKLINLLERRGLVWHGTSQQEVRQTIASGYPELDKALAGGFPKHSVIEFESDFGIGELRLLLQSYKQSCQQVSDEIQATQSQPKLFVAIALPGIINAELLNSMAIPLDHVIQITPKDQQQALWAAEQCLKSGSCETVVLWQQQALTVTEVKRLQQACEQGQATQFLIKAQVENEIKISLPVTLKLRLKSQPNGLSAKIKKRKGGWPNKAFDISMEKHWPMLCVTSEQVKKRNNLIAFPKTKRA